MTADFVKIRTTACALLTSAMIAVVTACSVSQPMPEDHYYRLPPAKPGRTLDRPLAAGTVSIAPITARGLYQERAILYTDSRTPLELHLYNYRYWVQSPSRLIQGHMIDYMRAAHVADKVTRYEPGTTAAAVISGHIRRFERLVGGARDRVMVSLDLRYGSGRYTAPAFEKTYTVTVPMHGRTMEAVVMAFGTALDRLCGRFVRDLDHAARRGTLLRAPGNGPSETTRPRPRHGRRPVSE